MKLLKTLLFLAAPFILHAQANVYSGNAVFNTQAAVDAFGSQYTKVTGKLQVYGSNVKNLSALSNIDTVLGKLEIVNTDSLTSLNGLQVKYVGNNVYLETNKRLRDISALATVKFIGKDLVVLDCDSLKSLAGLQNVDTIGGSIYIGTQAWVTPAVARNNDMLDNLCALSNVITKNAVTGSYYVANNAYNPAKTDYAASKCASVVFNGNVQLGSQAEVNAFTTQYTKITGKLQVYGANVKDLAPLSKIDTVLGKVEIVTTDSLASLNGLNIKYIGNNLYLEANKRLRDISALTKVKFVGKDLVILDCDSLKTLSGLENIDSIKGSLYIGIQAWTTPAVAKSNDLLENLCALTNVITKNGLTGTYNVANNAHNPIVADYAAGKCFSVIYNGNVQFSTQAEVDAFGSHYKIITGKLQVFGSNVKNLAAFSNIDTVRGKLEILNTDSLASLNGLNVKYVGNNVYFEANKMLRSLAALQSLKFIGKDLIILDCDTLASLNGLQNVDSIKGSIYIGVEGWKTPPAARSNDSLSNFCALNHVITSGGFLGSYFVANNAYNPMQTDFAAGKCTSNVFNGNVQLGSQAEIDAFSNKYKVVTGKLQVFGATSKNLAPLSGIDTVLGKLEILTTDSLESLDGLNVKYVGSNVYLDGNKALKNINALNKLTFIGKDLVILDCDLLTSLNGLDNVDSIKGTVYIGTEAWKTPPVARGNDTLVDFCAIKDVVNNGGLLGAYNVDFNNYNPSKADLANNKCLKPVTSVNSLTAKTGWAAFTSQADFMVRVADNVQVKAVRLYDINGRMIDATASVNNGFIKISHNAYPSGMYILVAEHKDGIERFRLVK